MLNDFEHQDTFTLLYIHILLFDRLARPFALHHIRQAEAHTHERGHDSPPRSEKIEHSSLCGASGSSSCGSIPYAFYSYEGGGHLEGRLEAPPAPESLHQICGAARVDCEAGRGERGVLDLCDETRR